MNDVVANLKESSVRLLLAALLNSKSEMSYTDAVTLAGITHPQSYRVARKELEAHGFLTEVKEGRRVRTTISVSTSAPVVQPVELPPSPVNVSQPEPEPEPTVDLVSLFQSIYHDSFSGHAPLSTRMAKEWVKVGLAAEDVQSIVEDIAQSGRTIQAPPTYILSALKKEVEKAAQKPVESTNRAGVQEFKSLEEAMQHWQPDPLMLQAENMRKMGVEIKTKLAKWAITDDDVKED